MKKFSSINEQDKAIQNFIENLSDVEVDDEDDFDTSDEGLYTFFCLVSYIYCYKQSKVLVNEQMSSFVTKHTWCSDGMMHIKQKKLNCINDVH